MTDLRKRSTAYTLAVAAGLAVLAACSSMPPAMNPNTQSVALASSNEVPPVPTGATGTGWVTVNPDMTVAAKITVTGMTATMAHIHMAAAGTNGPVIVPFVKTADNTFEAPAGAKMTDAQYAAYKAGNTYVNVHSAAHPGGEVRAQLKP